MPSRSANHEAGTAPVPRLAVLLPLPLEGPYDYRLDAEATAAAGDFVIVPLGRVERVGVVWGEAEGSIADARLKPIAARLDCPPLPAELRRFVDWVAAYTLTPPGAVLRMCMSVSAALEPPAQRIAYKLGGPPPPRLTAARARVLSALAEGPPRTAADLAETAAVGPGVVRGLLEAGVIEVALLPPAPPFGVPDWRRPGHPLSPAQAAAAAALRDKVAAAAFSVTLLEGVTGAGKTEVYFEAMAATLAAGRQVLVLLPEIALSAQWLERFARRFGVPPAEWHSDLRQVDRRRTWRAVAEGRAPVVVGARSALFLPFPDLGLIIVDEEHDGSFKQEDGVIYNARDMAVVRGSLGRFPVVLASATPSLETIANVAAGRYGKLDLPDRHGPAALPEIVAIDMRKTPPPPGRWLSPPLHQAVTETLAGGEQVMLFLNRRGYAPLTLCGACGHRLQCPSCSAWLVEHRLAGRLQCHHCGYAAVLPKACPACGVEDKLKPCGPGVERLAEEVAAAFPEARTAVMASDTISGPRAAAKLVQAVTEHRIDLLIGTQIVAKGHHFPMLTLVGVIDADLGLSGGDLRATERTFQLLTQVSGRAGRAERPGRVLLQTYMPENPVMQALVKGDRDGFIAAELQARREAGMPPFGRLAALIVSGPNLGSVTTAGLELGRRAPRGPDIEVLGPAPAAMALLRGRHRQRLLLKVDKAANIQQILRGWLEPVRIPNDVRLQIDIDPYSFF